MLESLRCFLPNKSSTQRWKKRMRKNHCNHLERRKQVLWEAGMMAAWVNEKDLQEKSKPGESSPLTSDHTAKLRKSPGLCEGFQEPGNGTFTWTTVLNPQKICIK